MLLVANYFHQNLFNVSRFFYNEYFYILFLDFQNLETKQNLKISVYVRKRLFFITFVYKLILPITKRFKDGKFIILQSENGDYKAFFLKYQETLTETFKICLSLSFFKKSYCYRSSYQLKQ